MEIPFSFPVITVGSHNHWINESAVRCTVTLPDDTAVGAQHSILFGKTWPEFESSQTKQSHLHTGINSLWQKPKALGQMQWNLEQRDLGQTQWLSSSHAYLIQPMGRLQLQSHYLGANEHITLHRYTIFKEINYFLIIILLIIVASYLFECLYIL